MFGVLETVSTPDSTIYDTYETLVKELSSRLEEEGHKFVKARSHRAKVTKGQSDGHKNDIIRCDLVCDRGGRPYKCTATKQKTSTKKTGCPWSAKAVYRKSVGGWQLTISCDQHNHEPRNPETPTSEHHVLEPTSDVEITEETSQSDDPQPNPESRAAFDIAGVTNEVVRLSGDTFDQCKADYRKMSPNERLNILGQMQLRIAALYAIQNEDAQGQKGIGAQEKRHAQLDGNSEQVKQTAKKSPRRTTVQNTTQLQLQNSSQSHPSQPRLQGPGQLLPPQQQQRQSRQGIQIRPTEAHCIGSRRSALTNPSPFNLHRSTEMILPIPDYDEPVEPYRFDASQSMRKKHRIQ